MWAEDSFGGSVNPTFNPEVAAQMGGEAVRIGAYLLAGGQPVGRAHRLGQLQHPLRPRRGDAWASTSSGTRCPSGSSCRCATCSSSSRNWTRCPATCAAARARWSSPWRWADYSFRLGSVISFEGAFPRYLRSEVRAGAQVMVVATNEGSYGRGPASDQLIEMVRLNAAAVGVDVVHAAVTGHSTFVSADGSRAGAETGLFTARGPLRDRPGAGEPPHPVRHDRGLAGAGGHRRGGRRPWWWAGATPASSASGPGPGAEDASGARPPGAALTAI